jgi:hypothetical protein
MAEGEADSKALTADKARTSSSNSMLTPSKLADVLASSELLLGILVHSTNNSLTAALRVNRHWYSIAGRVLYHELLITRDNEAMIYSRFPPMPKTDYDQPVVDLKCGLLRQTRFIIKEGTQCQPHHVDAATHTRLKTLRIDDFSQMSTTLSVCAQLAPSDKFVIDFNAVQSYMRPGPIRRASLPPTMTVEVAIDSTACPVSLRLLRRSLPLSVTCLRVIFVGDYSPMAPDWCTKRDEVIIPHLRDLVLAAPSDSQRKYVFYLVDERCWGRRRVPSWERHRVPMNYDWEIIRDKVQGGLVESMRKRVSFRTVSDYVKEGWRDEIDHERRIDLMEYTDLEGKLKLKGDAQDGKRHEGDATGELNNA